MVILWPALIVAVLLLTVQAFIVSNARAEAEVAASAGLREAWHFAANEDFTLSLDESGNYINTPYTDDAPHPKVRQMADAAQDAAAEIASNPDGWRWWRPDVAVVYSNWCADGHQPQPTEDRADRPAPGETGWVRVVISGDVVGPLAAFWPGRVDAVHASAEGPLAVELSSSTSATLQPPAGLPACD